MSTKSVDFRPLPTPEQVWAHGEGGLWEGKTETTSSCTWYKLWDKPREGSWWDSSVCGWHGFCAHGGPWTAMRGKPPVAHFRPLNPDGTPRDWAEIDAIVAQEASTAPATAQQAPEPEPDYHAPTDAELRAHVANGGYWQRVDGKLYEIWVDAKDRFKGWYHGNSVGGLGARGSGWDIADHSAFTSTRKHLRPVDKQGKPMPWPTVAQSATIEDWRPLPDTATLKRHRYWRSKPSENGYVYYIHTTQTGKYDVTANIAKLSTLSLRWEIDTDRNNENMIIGPRRRWQPCDVQGNILPWSAIAVPAAQPSALAVTPSPDGKFQAGDVVKLQQFSCEEKFSGGNPGWNPRMAEHLTKTVAVEFVGRYIRAAGWNWPVERVSFVSRPSKAEPEQKPIEAAVPAATALVPEFRKLTREIVEANPGQLWESEDANHRGRVWRLAYQGKEVADFACGVVPWNRDGSLGDFPWSDYQWRPLLPQSTYDNRQPMPWSELKTTVYRVFDFKDSLDFMVSLNPTTPLPKDGDPITVASAVAIAREGARQAMQEVGQVQKPAASFKAWSPDGECQITSVSYSEHTELTGSGQGITFGEYKVVCRVSGDLGRLPLTFDLVVQRDGKTDILMGCRRMGTVAASYAYKDVALAVTAIFFDGLPSCTGLNPTDLTGKTLDIAAEQWYSLVRQPNETDEQLRQRCRDAKAKENPMPTIPGVTMATMSTPAIPNFAAMSPEDRARYRAALDAADPPTFRDALRSGLEHAPVELALDKLHTFVSRLADLWTEGNEEERATVRRFLRDLLSSDYGKAAIGLGAGAAIPHAAPLAAKLLPDDKDAGPLLRRVGFILVERGTATGAKRLGLDIWDAAGPMLDELRQMLRDLVKGMKQADTVVGFLPPASPKLDFASGVDEVAAVAYSEIIRKAETVTQKR